MRVPLALSHTTGAEVGLEPNPLPVMVMVALWSSGPLTCCTVGAAITEVAARDSAIRASALARGRAGTRSKCIMRILAEECGSACVWRAVPWQAVVNIQDSCRGQSDPPHTLRACF